MRAGLAAFGREALDRLGGEALTFAVLRALTLIGGVAALFLAPLRPEHTLHLAPLLVGFVLYKAALFAVLVRWSRAAREIFLATLAADLALVFLLVWFTGGGESHFYLLFYPLVALNAHQFGPGVGGLAAGLAVGLLVAANALMEPAAPWGHIAARSALLGLLALALGHVAARERRARAEAARLHRAMEVTSAELARAQQLATVGRLSAKMAHEVRNPLGAINLNVDLLGDLVQACPGPAMGEARDLLREIREEVRALAALTDEYLVAARLPRPRIEKESLNDLCADLVTFLEPVARRQGVVLAVDLDPALPPVPADRAMIRQAIHNLVKNALEMLPGGGHVSVGTRVAGTSAIIAVADDGPGVPAEAAGRLFEPFFTTKRGGTGLGLSIARQIAEQHGGDVAWADRPGGGARFEIRLPMKGRDG